MPAIEFLLLPATCLLCGGAARRSLDLCLACEDDLPRQLHACARCAIPLPGADMPQCGKCIEKCPPQDRSIATFRYEYPLASLVQSFKFDGRQSVGRVLGELFAERLQANASPDFLLPVPLHPSRLRERGFNQAELLAQAIGCRHDLPVRLDVIARLRETDSQSGMSAVERRRNMRDAFSVRQPVKGASVAIIDDVMTTGSTVAEISRLLKADGARRVEAWVLARTP